MKFDSLKLFILVLVGYCLTPWNAFAWEHFGFEGDFEVVYDENVFEFSDSDQDEFDAGTNPNRFKDIESMDDFIFIPDVSADIHGEVIPESQSALGFRFVPKFHVENEERDYQKYKAYITHRLDRGDRFKLFYTRIPEYFVRNLLDFDLPEGTNRFRKAEFAYDSPGVDFLKIINDRISAKIGYSYEEKDYNREFDERDLSIHLVFGEIILKLCERLKIRGKYEFETAEADAQDDDPAVDFDTSHDQHAWTAKAAYEFLKTYWVDLRYSFYLRNYTTDNSATDDPFHAGRDDYSHLVSVGLSKEVNEHVECYVRYEYEVRNSDVDAASVGTLFDPAGAILEFDTNRVMVGSEIRF